MYERMIIMIGKLKNKGNPNCLDDGGVYGG